MKVCIDPGHAGKTNYANGYYESEGNWRFSQVLANVLRGRGIEVLMTKTSLADDPTLGRRGQMAAEWGADVFLSVHSDANNSSLRRGVHMIRSITKPDSDALGRRIVANMASAMGIPLRDNPVWTRVKPTNSSLDWYGVLNQSANYKFNNPRGTGRDVPNSFLIECGYHTNPDDVAKLKDASLDIKRAEAIANALREENPSTGQEDDMKRGDKGEAVKRWQTRLIEWNANALPRFGADADFGGETETATNAFKASVNLPQDGIVDALTWDAMVGVQGKNSALLEAEKQRADTATALLASERTKSAFSPSWMI